MHINPRGDICDIPVSYNKNPEWLGNVEEELNKATEKGVNHGKAP